MILGSCSSEGGLFFLVRYVVFDCIMFVVSGDVSHDLNKSLWTPDGKENICGHLVT